MRAEKDWLEPCKIILLTGAGFTKDFGGYLGKEMWSHIFNQPEIKESENLQKFMRDSKDYDYETIYDNVLRGENFTCEEKEAFKKSVRNAYQSLHEVICQDDNQRRSRASAACRIFLRPFAGLGQERGFIFTLNQDLFVERYFMEGDFLVRIPGAHRPKWFNGQLGRSLAAEDEVRLLEEEGVKEVQSKFWKRSSERLAYVKLHGSFGWKSSDGSDVMVIGHSKTEIIQKEPLLRFYLCLFKEVLGYGNRVLVVVGYGFGDEHINKIIAEAIKLKGLRLHVVSPKTADEFRNELNPIQASDVVQKPYAVEILSGLVGHHPYRVTDFYQIGQAQPTAEGRQFLQVVGFV